MNRKPTVVVDADALVAQAFPGDSNHEKAVAISKKLNELEAQVLYPATAVLEATTVLQGKLDRADTAYVTAITLCQPEVQIVEINHQTLTNALKYFRANTSKRNTLFDCVILEVANQYQAEAVFSFDKFYRSRGLKLAGDL